MSSEAVAEEAPPPPPPAEGGDDAPAPAETPAEPAEAPAEAPPAPAEGEAKEAEAPAEAPPPAPDEQQPGEAAAEVPAEAAEAPAEAAEAPAAAAEEAAPAPVSGDEESQRATTAEVVKELLGVALKEAAGAQKGVTYEGEAKPAAGSEDRLPKEKAPSAEDAGIEKPAPVPSEFKKEELVVKDRKSKQSMAKVHKSSFRFRTISGSALVIQAGKGPKYENSYWLTSKSPFNVDKVNEMLREVVDDRVSKVSSEKPKLQDLSSSIVTETLAKIKQMSYERYRFVCVCLVGEKIDQGLRCSLRMLWDAEQDNYAWYTVEQTRYFVVASVYGIYYD